jgi:hypothetical protein
MKWVLSLSVFGASIPAAAQEVDQSFRETMAACERIADVAQRVTCYDSAASKLRGSPPPEVVTQQAHPVGGNGERTAFGLSGRDREAELRRHQSERAPPINEISAQVRSSREALPGAWLIELSDGGTWQTETRSDFMPPRVGSDVTIRHGSLGGYFLEAGGRPSIRVTRRR